MLTPAETVISTCAMGYDHLISCVIQGKWRNPGLDVVYEVEKRKPGA